MATRQPLLVVPDATACARWENRWLTAGQRTGAWFRPPVMTVGKALDEIASRIGEHRLGMQPISAVQSEAIWEKIILDSPAGRNLISATYAVRAARDAWDRLHQYGVDWRAIRPYPDEQDFAAFLDWSVRYRDTLEHEQWIDRSLAVKQMVERDSPGELNVGVCGLEQIPPATAAALTAWSRQDVLNDIAPGVSRARVRNLRVDDARTELAAAADWADACLRARDGTSAVAVIVPDAPARAAEIDSLFGDVAAGHGRNGSPMPVWRADGARPTKYPALGAAVSALECLCGRGGFSQFSRWLRSSFFAREGGETVARRAAFEAGFRSDLLAQWPFREAFRRGGLAGTLTRALPGFSAAAGQALFELEKGSARRHPVDWAACWVRCLRMLGWCPETLGTPAAALTAWDGAMQSFASLSAITGVISVTEALDRFRRLLDANCVRPPMPAGGIHIFDRPQQVGPGYAGIWITGFTDRVWPIPPRLNPLLPLRLQRDCRMPFSTPELAHEASVRLLDRLSMSAPDIICSSPAQAEDIELLPSTMLEELRAEDYVEQAPAHRSSYCADRVAARRQIPVVEDVPPAQPGRIHGGMRMLALQSGCPLRAFCEIRLGATPLEIPARGISRQMRGMIVHRALELLFGPLAGTGPVSVHHIDAGVSAAVRRAVAESVGYADAPWDLIARLETERTERALNGLLEREKAREAFEIVDVERQVQLEIDGWVLNGRIDRIDKLADGGLVIIDYKTGRLPSAAAWFAERLLEPQMPAYALTQPGDVAAVVVISVGDDKVEFRAAGDLPADFPVRASPLSISGDWSGQLRRWHERIAALLDEFGHGDVRVLRADTSPAVGPYAVLTRIHAAVEAENRVVSSVR